MTAVDARNCVLCSGELEPEALAVCKACVGVWKTKRPTGRVRVRMPAPDVTPYLHRNGRAPRTSLEVAARINTDMDFRRVLLETLALTDHAGMSPTDIAITSGLAAGRSLEHVLAELDK